MATTVTMTRVEERPELSELERAQVRLWITFWEGFPVDIEEWWALNHQLDRVDIAVDGEVKYQLYADFDAGLLLRAGTTTPIGHAIQHDFFGKDPEAWEVLASMEAEIKALEPRFLLAIDVVEAQSDEFDFYDELVERAGGGD